MNLRLPASYLAAALLLTALPGSAFAQRNYPPSIPDAEAKLYKTIDEVELSLFVFKPEGWKASDSRPAAVFFFGGGWKSGSPVQFVEQCKHLANQGMVAITVDYRVASRHQTKAVDCVIDARDAMHWVRSHCGELGINPQHIAAGGGSAGGHIAACLGTIKPGGEEKVSSRPDAMFLFNPACVIAAIDGKHPWAEDRTDELTERMGTDPEALSPAHHVSASSPPCIIFHGKADSTVPYSTAETFTEKMHAAGVRCELKGYKGEQHGFFNFGKNDNKAFDESMRQLDIFIVSLGWIEAS